MTKPLAEPWRRRDALTAALRRPADLVALAKYDVQPKALGGPVFGALATPTPPSANPSNC